MHMEGHSVGQAPTVADGGVLTGPEQRQVAMVAVQVLMLPCLQVHAGLVWPRVDGEDGLAHPLGCLSRGSFQPQRLHTQARIMMPVILAEPWVGKVGSECGVWVSLYRGEEDMEGPRAAWAG